MIIKKKYNNYGDKRTVKRFALFPVRIDDDTLIWLEYYYSTEVYYHSFINDFWEVIDVKRIKS
jgi:hypothetical protein